MKERKIDKKRLFMDKTKIKNNKYGKLSIKIYPEIHTTIKNSESNSIEKSLSSNDFSIVYNDVTFNTLADFDKIKDIEFDYENGEKVYKDILNFLYQILDICVEDIYVDTTREDHIKNVLLKSVNKAIKHNAFTFKKLNDIIQGHQDITNDEKEDLVWSISNMIFDDLNNHQMKDNKNVKTLKFNAKEEEMLTDEEKSELITMRKWDEEIRKKRTHEEDNTWNMYEGDEEQ